MRSLLFLRLAEVIVVVLLISTVLWFVIPDEQVATCDFDPESDFQAGVIFPGCAESLLEYLDEEGWSYYVQCCNKKECGNEHKNGRYLCFASREEEGGKLIMCRAEGHTLLEAVETCVNAIEERAEHQLVPDVLSSQENQDIIQQDIE